MVFLGYMGTGMGKIYFFSEDRICGKRGYFSLFGITLEGVKEL